MFIIIPIVILIVSLVIYIIDNIHKDEDGVNLSFVSGFFASVAMCTAIAYYSYKDKPTAMDVYRGNTTLRITYQDSLPVDSVVVFKNK